MSVVKLFKISAVLLSVLYVCSCGTSSHSRLAESSNGVPLVLVMGGNNSCKEDPTGLLSPFGMDMFAPFRIFKEDIVGTIGAEFDYVLSCHTSTADVRFYTSRELEEMQILDRQQFYGEVESLWDLSGADSVVLVGHSFGGWLGMKMVLEMDRSRNFDSLFTLDPISRVNCSFSTPSGCVSAPTDIVGQQRELINEYTSLWENYYQTSTFYLHSSEIAEADYNEKLRVGHTSVDTHETPWGKITDRVKGLSEERI